MRILILSANTGGGHNSTAKAIAEQFEKQGVSCEIADCLSYISERVSGFISWGHSYVYRKWPRLFGFGYRYEEKHPPKFIYNRCAKGADGLYQKLQEGFDGVACVHSFAGLMMAAVKDKYTVNVPFFFVATDYTCSPGVAESGADLYFVPHKLLFDEFIRAGISADKLQATGIPILEVFHQKADKQAARRALELPQDQRIVLLGGGSMGAGNLGKEAMRLLERLPSDTCLCVLCGKNRKVYDALREKANERLFVVSFTNEMASYMSAADLYITKPGGLTSTEAIAKRLPVVFINAVPGCETRNFNFLIENGVACGARKWKSARELVIKQLSDPKLSEQSIGQMNAFMPHQPAEQLCRHIVDYLSK
ncbi:MAG: glycosyltransferase [Clostridia bacterium]|nr:glycosyltransferase [Clostridia bacterium]